MSTVEEKCGEVRWIDPCCTGPADCTPTARSGCSATLLDDTVWVFGGCGYPHVDDIEAVPLADLYALELASQSSWVALPPITGSPPAARWHHTATAVNGQLWVFGGVLADGHRTSTVHVFDPKAAEWTEHKPANEAQYWPVGRSHHSATAIDGDRVLVIGGLAAAGQICVQLEILDCAASSWAPLRNHGSLQQSSGHLTPRFGHSTSRAGGVIIVAGGQDMAGVVDDVSVLDLATLVWTQCNADRGERPISCVGHVAVACETATSWKMFSFGGRLSCSSLHYSDQVSELSCETFQWKRTLVEHSTAEGETDPAREGAAAVWDVHRARLLMFGGWSRMFHEDVLALDVSGIVGPRYACTSVTPTSAAISGGTTLLLKGVGFSPPARIRFEAQSAAEGKEPTIAEVEGVVVDSNTITCTTPALTRWGSKHLLARASVMCGENIFSVDRVLVQFYLDSKPAVCIPYGPGVMKTVFCNLPATIYLRAHDSIGRSRVTGNDKFTVCAHHLGEQKHDAPVDGVVEDHHDGSYTCNWIAPSAGLYELSVLLDGHHVRGSPFSITAVPSDCKLASIGPPSLSDEARSVWVRGEGVVACLHDGGRKICCLKGLEHGAEDPPCEWVDSEVMLEESQAKGHQLPSNSTPRIMLDDCVLWLNVLSPVATKQARLKRTQTFCVSSTGHPPPELMVLCKSRFKSAGHGPNKWEINQLRCSGKISASLTGSLAISPGYRTKHQDTQSTTAVLVAVVGTSGSVMAAAALSIELADAKTALWFELFGSTAAAPPARVKSGVAVSPSRIFMFGGAEVGQQQGEEEPSDRATGKQPDDADIIDQVLQQMESQEPGSDTESEGESAAAAGESEAAAEGEAEAAAGEAEAAAEGEAEAAAEGEAEAAAEGESEAAAEDEAAAAAEGEAEGEGEAADTFPTHEDTFPTDEPSAATPEVTGRLLDELWVLECEDNCSLMSCTGCSWSLWSSKECSGNAPCARTDPYMSWLNGSLLVMGGKDEKGQELYDAHVLLTETKEWKMLFGTSVHTQPWMPPCVSMPTALLAHGFEKKALCTVSLQNSLWHNSETQLMQQLVQAELKQLKTLLNKIGGKLDNDVEDGDEERLIAVMQLLQQVEPLSLQVDLQFDGLRQMIKMVEAAGVECTRANSQCTMYSQLWNSVKERAPKVKTQIWPLRERESRKLQSDISIFSNQTLTIRSDLLLTALFKHELSPAEAYARMAIESDKLKQVERKMTELSNLADLFESRDLMDPAKQRVTGARSDLVLVCQLWDLISMVQSYIEEWASIEWIAIEPQAILLELQGFQLLLRNIDRRARSFEAYDHIKKVVSEMVIALPVIGELKQGAMKARHWNKVMEVTKKHINHLDIEHTKMVELLELDLHQHTENLARIVDCARKEAKIETSLEELATTWRKIDFEVVPWHGELTVVSFDASDVIEQLENDQLVVQTIAASRYVAMFSSEISTWMNQLRLTSDVICELKSSQKIWCYLRGLFIECAEVRREMKEDSDMFDRMDKEMQHIVASCRGNMKQISSADGFLDKLLHLNDNLRRCEKALINFLDSKRRAFARFFFMSTKDLVDVLANTARPAQLQQHMCKIFGAVASLDLRQSVSASGEDLSVALGVYSPQDEYLSFSNPCRLDCEAEVWMKRLLCAIQAAVHRAIKQALEDSDQVARTEFLVDNQAQMVLVVAQILWANRIEAAFGTKSEEGEPAALKTQWLVQCEQLEQLVLLVRSELGRLDRLKAMNLITQDAHQRDILQALHETRVDSASAFEWQSKLRVKWNAGASTECTVCVCSAELAYGYEYLGACSRLVCTPLTGRIYITATQALSLQLGCAPAGPAGTGKTETTKDLSAQVGVPCYVFNCSEQMDYQSLACIFKGLGASGAWGCFDEFNRIGPEVLSVVTMQYASVLEALSARSEYFELPGDTHQLPLNHAVGVFITMNPGYLGRSELPEGLKALFRPVTVVVPDLELICENMLMAQGFTSAQSLAHKFVVLYRQSADLLSKQRHYDWGLRAIKCVLCVAGGFRRAEPALGEDAILMRALRDTNISKIVGADKGTFLSLVQDIFRGVQVPERNDVKLAEAAAEACCAQGLQPDTGFIHNVIQLNELLVLRHCVFVLGPPSCGKSSTSKCLAAANRLLGQVTEVEIIDPKAISTDQLYGFIDFKSREWKDGLLSLLLREKSNSDPSSAQWVMLDGDLDANWIESMNSVMDDNKLLTLASNERIALKPNTRLMFEISSLKYATPATVSRAGILYICMTEQQLTTYCTSWAQKNYKPAVSSQLLELVKKYVPATVARVANLMKKQKADDQGEALAMVASLCTLLDSLLGGSKNVESRLMEAYFCFAAVWAFGGGMGGTASAVELRGRFSRWWRNEWRSARFPDAGTVFDYYIDTETGKFMAWKDLVQGSYRLQPGASMREAIVPTAEGAAIDYWTRAAINAYSAVLLSGPAGCGKTANALHSLHSLDEAIFSYRYLSFSYYTDAEILRNILNASIEKKAGLQYGPVAGVDRLVVLLDDLNTARVDDYGTQTPITLLRQHLDHGFWHDTVTLQRKHVSRVQYVAAMNPSSGSCSIDPRCQRHFVCLDVTVPSESSIHEIYSSLLTAAMGDFQSAISGRIPKLITAGVELHSKVVKTFRRTASRYHYEFNMRQLGRMFAGVASVESEALQTSMDLVRLWLHEAHRAYGDLLVTREDQDQFCQTANDIVSKHFGQELLVDKTLLSGFNVWAHLSEAGSGGLGEAASYKRVHSVDSLQASLMEALEQYNSGPNASMDLVLFLEAMQHITRIRRAMETGHTLLAGVGGSGRQSLTRLAAAMHSSSLATICASKGYSLPEFTSDIAELYQRAGVRGEHVCLLLTDNQIVDERFLMLLNDLLAHGNAPQLFCKEDRDSINAEMVTQHRGSATVDTSTHEACWNQFICQVRSNLRVVLCMSPMSAVFNERLRRFPSLTSSTVIDWFHPWPADALLSVSERFLADLNLDIDKSGVIDEEEIAAHQSIIRFMPYAFDVVNTVSAQYREQEGGCVYTTPKSFLGLISLYRVMFDKKYKELSGEIDRTRMGLEKLGECAEQVATLHVVVEEKNIEVSKSLAEISTLSEKMGREKDYLADETTKATAESAKCEEIAATVGAQKIQCDEELKKAIPAVERAMKALDTIVKKDLQELKNFKRPPTGVDDVLSAVIVLMSPPEAVAKDKSWPAATKMMLQLENFMISLRSFKERIDQGSVPKANFKAVRAYMQMEHFTAEVIKRKSSAAAGLCEWAINIVGYYDIVTEVEPKHRALAEATEMLENANTKNQKMKLMVVELEKKLAAMQQEYAGVVKAKDDMLQEVADLEQKLQLAGRLEVSLASEKERWGETITQRCEQLQNLPGDSLLAASMVAYGGAFNWQYRQQLIWKHWVPKIKEGGIALAAEPDPLSFLSSSSEVAKWTMSGLPRDALSAQNGAIVCNTSLWPLIIDPQLQALHWLRTHLSEATPVVEVRQGSDVRKVARACAEGSPVLLTGVEHEVDASLMPLVGQQFVEDTADNSRSVRIGESDVIVAEGGFMMVLHCKLSQPQFPPELQAETTVVNFGVTREGLEDQLLAMAVGLERPQLETIKQQLLTQQSEFTLQQVAIEDALLHKLCNTEGDILRNVSLVEDLEQSKRLSTEISEKAAVAVKTGIETNTAREVYRPVASRASLVFFVLSAVSRISAAYTLSLGLFKPVYESALRSVPESDELQGSAYINGLIEEITVQAWAFVQRGLLEEHKLAVLCTFVFAIQKEIGAVCDRKITVLQCPPLAAEAACGRMSEKLPFGTSQWAQLCSLFELGEQLYANDTPFEAIRLSLDRQSPEWCAWMELTEPETEPLPAENCELSPIDLLLLTRILRPDRITFAVSLYLSQVLHKPDNYLLQSAEVSIDKLHLEASATRPVMFVLCPGVSPYEIVADFGATKGFTEAANTLHRVSLGQGQNEIAERLLGSSVAAGHWLFLENLHLLCSWLPALERRLENVSRMAGSLLEQQTHFRLWLSTDMPSQHTFELPQGLLDVTIKVVSKPPSSVKANLMHALALVDQHHCIADLPHLSTLFFSLCVFHSLVLSRGRFGSLGWSRRYSFGAGDLKICASVIAAYTASCEVSNGEPMQVPWADLEYLIVDVMYGGHITDQFDRRICKAQLDSVFGPRICKAAISSDGQAELIPGLPVPAGANSVTELQHFVESNFPAAGPHLFGLHRNAEISVLEAQSGLLCDTMLKLTRFSAASATGDAAEDAVLLALEQLPMPIDVGAEGGAHEASDLHCVVLQECSHATMVVRQVRAWLDMLQEVLQGTMAVTSMLTTQLESLSRAQVPSEWLTHCPSGATLLGSWLSELNKRMNQLDTWWRDKIPHSIWLPGLFNPRALLTAVVQLAAQTAAQPLDAMSSQLGMTANASVEMIEEPAVDAQYLHGLWMEGARWDCTDSAICECWPRKLHSECPVMSVRGVLDTECQRGLGYFECPIYSTSLRGPTYVVSAHLPCNQEDVKRWILAGAAMILCLAN